MTKAIRFAAMMLFVPTAAVQAASFPEKPVTLLVPYSAGGITDQIARILADKLGKQWEQPVVVENKPGAGAAIGTAAVANGKADGYQFLIGSVGTVTNQFMLKSLPYKTQDLEPLLQISEAPNVLYVRSSLPVKSVTELVDYAKKNPGKLTFANSGIGSSPHLAAALFQDKAKISITNVPYRGTSAAIADFLGGQVDAYFDTMQSMPYVKQGKLTVLGVAAQKRVPSHPDVPTIAESGIADVLASSWFGVFIPAKTPDAIKTEISKAITEAMQDRQTTQKIENLGTVIQVRDRQQFKQFFDKETQRWGELIKRLNIAGS
ncbi:tripartite-type tricarboxylate transporter receptor subunit TctC [Advenella incenata]|jgi:tripartite-type tricarboxylate transporter receptor subunit TctC|uniref:Tripartite-type tricarboxylate transporter receptor subunit TctC n=1 Tax=Advenella incenata TaxID=267800 RepID=A0A4Q7VRY5_9BURK|nr:tripartite tricarboxylate transporter substrate binding protein [Advenella incenata]RZT99296.1 tripartite-type tricarboxylate transporter receptor subunit TctC [Advenella incenata]